MFFFFFHIYNNQQQIRNNIRRVIRTGTHLFFRFSVFFFSVLALARTDINFEISNRSKSIYTRGLVVYVSGSECMCYLKRVRAEKKRKEKKESNSNNRRNTTKIIRMS